jgi:hypothetical protein
MQMGGNVQEISAYGEIVLFSCEPQLNPLEVVVLALLYSAGSAWAPSRGMQGPSTNLA